MVAPRTYLTADEIDAIAAHHYILPTELAAVADAVKDARMKLAADSLVCTYRIAESVVLVGENFGASDPFEPRGGPESLYTFKVYGRVVVDRMAADGRFHPDGTLRLWRDGESSYRLEMVVDLVTWATEIRDGRVTKRLIQLTVALVDAVIETRLGTGEYAQALDESSVEQQERKDEAFDAVRAQLLLDGRLNEYNTLFPWPDGEDAYAERIRDLAARGALAAAVE